MSRDRRTIWMICVTLAVAAASTVAPAALAGSHALRLPAADADAVYSLGVRPLHDLDYGSFRWLVVDDISLDRIEAAGVPHDKVEDATTVQVQGFVFDPVADGEPAIPDGLRASGDRAGLHLLQLIGPVRDEWVAALAEAGIQLLQYYPHNAYLVWADPDTMAGLEALPFVRWQGRFHPAYKINESLEGRGGNISNVDVMFYAEGVLENVLQDFEKLGAVVIQHYPSQPDKAFYDAIIQVNAGSLEDIARMTPVLWLGYQSPEPILDDEMSSQIVAGNYTGGVPFVGYESWLNTVGFDGSGVIWSITDTGVDYQHPDLNTRIVGGHDYPGCTPVPGEPGNDCGGGHGTHVSGIVGGDATAGYSDPQGFKYGWGIAPGVSFFAQNSVDNGGPWPPAGGWQEHSKWATLGGAVGGNQSWTTGEGTAHGYQASERTHDIMVHDGNFDTATVAEPYIQVFSAGNSGPGSQTLTSPKEAKNIITVAASMNYRSGSIDALASYSSRGPAVDGRIKPDIAAPGDQIASTRNDTGGSCSTPISGTNNMYAYCSGTSMAAPHISGSVALVTDWWRSFNGGANPSAAMAKALLINGTVDMATADRPNFNEGWGRVQLTNVVNNATNMVYKDQQLTFNNTGENLVVAVGIPDPGKPLRVTLVWTDAPGAVGANPALVNNLDLTVETNGNTYKGNVFSGGWSTTGGTADIKNNVENVFVASPGGDAVITINATAIVGDGVYYSGDTTDQNFALVCYNCAEQADFILDVDPDSVAVCAPTSATYDVAIGSILGFDDPVTLGATGNPAGTTVGFTVNPVIPVGSSVMTIGSTGSGAPGSYTVDVSGTSTTGTKTRSVGLDLFNATPGVVTLVAPANGATNQPARPTFEWAAATQGGTYQLQVATDSGFVTLVIDESGIAGTTFTPNSDLMTNTEHWWRVRSTNACGSGGWSAVRSFTTEAMPGDCGLGTIPSEEYFDDFEAGVGLWTHSGTGDSWALSTARSYSASHSFHANDPSTSSDQRLVSPSVVLPASSSPLTLQFWNWQLMEDSSSGCYDGGLVEISTNDGGTWTHLPDAVMLTDPYDGPVTGLGGLDGWCDDLGAPATVWKKAVVDIDAYAGQTVRFRFRIGSDGSVSREGWYVDDVYVQSCIPDSPDFTLSATPDTAQICQGDSAEYTVNVGSIVGFSNPVTLGASGNPAGTTAGFSPNPVTPPGSSLLTIGNTGAVPAGGYPITITGTASGSGGHSLDVMLDVIVPAAPPTLTAPPDGAIDQPLRPVFQWAAAAGADSYWIQIDDDPAFGSPAIDESGITVTTFTPTSDLEEGTTYYWRVSSENLCGPGAASTVFSFETLSTMPFADGFESGDTSAWSATVP
ncbi:MAG TPA: S8 family serine peptidase [Thermoanaerobaculales bacterium]|nr:S8 family serine peptidase [Thermoanaerobaculales bacterium]HQL29120.1 S8 family serine peptidase [Thermoanaerobaculales bacterium]